MSELHVVVGAGPVGRATAHELVEACHEVLLVSRSGAGPDLPGVRRAAADAADADRLVELSSGAVAIYNCVNPSDYTVWSTFWPPLAEALASPPFPAAAAPLLPATATLPSPAVSTA